MGTKSGPAWATIPYLQYVSGQLPRSQFNTFRPQGLPNNQVPSFQQWGQLMPSEQKGYGGYLKDELGLDPNDVYALMTKLRPQGYMGLPRWAGG